MKNFLRNIYNKAKQNPGIIVFPEGEEEKILQATAIINNNKIARPILIGDQKKIFKKAKKLNIKINNPIISNFDADYTKKYTREFCRIRPEINPDEAIETVRNINYFGTMMVHMNDAQAMISGVTCSTAETIRPALQIIKTKEKFHKVSGLFIIIIEENIILFADTAITIDPNSHDLADIAIDTAETAKKFNLTPKIAMLSFSTKGSAKHPFVKKVQEATEIVKNRRPDLIIDGEIQVDAALVPHICTKKAPKSPLKGHANILIFPDLNSGNIAYKLVERLGKNKAIGPILQGLLKPINDLSRGCEVDDIVNLAAITSLEIAETKLI